MVKKSLKVINRAGLHLRVLTKINKMASQFNSTLYLEKDSDRFDIKSIMGVLTMGAFYGTELVLYAEGPDEQAALDAISTMFENKFDED